MNDNKVFILKFLLLYPSHYSICLGTDLIIKRTKSLILYQRLNPRKLCSPLDVQDVVQRLVGMNLQFLHNLYLEGTNTYRIFWIAKNVIIQHLAAQFQ